MRCATVSYSIPRCCRSLLAPFSTTTAAILEGSEQQCPVSTSHPNASSSLHPNASVVRPFSDIPGPRGWPLIGNLRAYRKDHHLQYDTILKQMFAEYGPLVREHRGLKRGWLLHVFDPEDARQVFAAEGKMPYINPLADTQQLYRGMRDLSLGLGNMNGPEWYRLRSAVQQAMVRPLAVRKYLPLVEEVAADLVNAFRELRRGDDGAVKHAKQLIQKWSVESSGLLVFEKRLGALSTETYSTTAQWATDMVFANQEVFRLTGILKFSLPFYHYFSTPLWRKLVRAEDFVSDEAYRLINDTIEKARQATTSASEADREGLMFVSYLVSRPELAPEDIAIIAFSLFSDGLSTTAPTLIYNLYCLAANPDCQQRLRDEIHEHIGRKGDKTPITSQVLSKMVYLKACIKESFRLYPIGTELSRIPQTDLVLSGYQIPAGTSVDINMGPSLLDEKYFDRPMEYHPERWLRESPSYEGARLHPYAHTPFGHGPRMCAGRRFAEQDLQVALMRLVQTFHIDYEGERPLKQVMRTLLQPEDPFLFKFTDV